MVDAHVVAVEHGYAGNVPGRKCAISFSLAGRGSSMFERETFFPA